MNENPGRQKVTAILRRAMVDAFEWRLLTLFTATVLWTTLVATLPAWRALASVLDDSPRAKEIARSFDMLAFQDMGMALVRSAEPVTGGAALATVLGIFSWPFLAGMVIGAERRGARTFTETIEGGITYYARMLRIGLVALVPHALIGAVAAAAFGGARSFSRHAILESQATLAWRGAIAATLMVFVVVHATMEAGRAAFGAEDGLRSGWIAWLRGVRLTARHPWRVLGAYLGATVASYAVAVPLLILRLRLSGSSMFLLVLGFVVTQLAVASLGWGRTARLFALTALTRAESLASAVPVDAPDALPGDPQAVPSGSMFREIGPRNPVARRG